MSVTAEELERRVERFQLTCREAGIKVTHQRLEIFREVAGSDNHPDAETLFHAVRARIHGVSLDTVYRTLWLLTDLGLIGTLGASRDRARFDANLAPHHHYICVECGLTADFENPDFNDLRIPAGVRNFGSVLTTQVEVRGLCRGCAGKRPKT